MPAGRIQDVDALLISHVSGALEAEVVGGLPSGRDWPADGSPVVVLASAGGPPPFSVVLQRCEFVAEVYATDSKVAFDLAADLVAVIGDMPGRVGDVLVYEAALAVPHRLRNPALPDLERFVAHGTVLVRLANT